MGLVLAKGGGVIGNSEPNNSWPHLLFPNPVCTLDWAHGGPSWENPWIWQVDDLMVGY